MTKADTCHEFVTPKLVEAGWGAAESVIGERHSFTNDRIIVAGGTVRRGKQRRADYLLYSFSSVPRDSAAMSALTAKPTCPRWCAWSSRR
ncbi:MAG TPA: hypothetical protein VLA61_07695 [Ideonella sp.]|nr:hypothetical protein [Ideonella sp.]HSI48134.1 hypothetical protein [Ideonella sp.]